MFVFFCFFFTFSFFLPVIVLFLLNCCPPLENQIYMLQEKRVVPFWPSPSFSGPSRSQTNDTWHCLLKSLSCVEIPPPCPLLWCHELPQLILWIVFLFWSRFPHWSEIKINHSEAWLVALVAGGKQYLIFLLDMHNLRNAFTSFLPAKQGPEPKGSLLHTTPTP